MDRIPASLLGQAVLEVQFYPDAIVQNCSSDGGFNLTYAPGKFSVCTPVRHPYPESSWQSDIPGQPSSLRCAVG